MLQIVIAGAMTMTDRSKVRSSVDHAELMPHI